MLIIYIILRVITKKKHKYIRRTGSPGHYVYTYNNDNTSYNAYTGEEDDEWANNMKTKNRQVSSVDNVMRAIKAKKTKIPLKNLDLKKLATDKNVDPNMRKEFAKLQVQRNSGKKLNPLDVSRRLTKAISSSDNATSGTRKEAAKLNVALNNPETTRKKATDFIHSTLKKLSIKKNKPATVEVDPIEVKPITLKENVLKENVLKENKLNETTWDNSKKIRRWN